MAGNPGYFSNHSQTRLTNTTGSNNNPSPVSTPAPSGPNGNSLTGPNSRSRSTSGAAPPSAVRSKHFSLSVTGTERPSGEKGRGTSADRTGNGSGLAAVHPLKSTIRGMYADLASLLQLGDLVPPAPPTIIDGFAEEGIKRVTAFSSVESFWSIFTHLNPPSNLQPTTDYLIFHSGVQRPVWEDPMNVKGGKWSIRLRKGVADRLWEDLILALIGDQFEDEDEVCGCVLSVRIQEDIISIWNKDESNTMSRDTTRRVLNLPPSTTFEYKSHNESLQDKGSFRKLPATNDRVV
ncbi:eukaryotic translation initiation factor 4E class II [Rhizoctonia solani AG-1 IA]|uniref:Eukaryotic translation initiation factor 4E class II n=1 Tax=Thanatephorus cucumeris (strain AG1-IA) TaxID=983506 RepID=L8X2Z8_THACA|nr:eukaryotic translation initiation factor 4E class II [Rhizoctonia solani AG-1 IA]